jgi:hypothetical protein
MASDATGEIYVLQKTGGSEGVFVQPAGDNGASSGENVAASVSGRQTAVLGSMVAAVVVAWLMA